MSYPMSRILNKPALNEYEVSPDPKRPLEHCSVGIEIEVEGFEIGVMDSKRWRVSHDEGSLQGGVEFISLPVWGTAITDALDEIRVLFAAKPPYISFRTSVHVHINVLDMTNDQVIQMVKLGILYEPALFRLHEDWNRYDNMFCVPAKQSVAIQRAYSGLLHELKRGRAARNVLKSKYAAMNPNSISELGTLEFRHMGGTADMDKISQWIDILLQMKSAAMQHIPIENIAKVWADQRNQLTIRDKDLVDGQELIHKLEIWR